MLKNENIYLVFFFFFFFFANFVPRTVEMRQVKKFDRI
jgi:hypothetical protein